MVGVAAPTEQPHATPRQGSLMGPPGKQGRPPGGTEQAAEAGGLTEGLADDLIASAALPQDLGLPDLAQSFEATRLPALIARAQPSRRSKDLRGGS
jgi:hypothetical protein